MAPTSILQFFLHLPPHEENGIASSESKVGEALAWRYNGNIQFFRAVVLLAPGRIQTCAALGNSSAVLGFWFLEFQPAKLASLFLYQLL